MLKSLLSIYMTFWAFVGLAIELPQDFKEIKVQGEAIDYLVDPARKFTAEDVTFQKFESYGKLTPNFGFFNGNLWLRIKLNYSANQPIFLELKNPNLDEIVFFVRTKDGFKRKSMTGDEYSFRHRNRDHRFYQFQINGEREILLKINNKGDQLYIPISILSERAISKRDYKEQYIIGIYYGIILFVFILNLFIFIVIKERANLYYLLYLLGLIFLQLALGGFGFEYIWPNNPYIANHSLPFLATISVLFLLFFVQNFLSTKTNLPKFNRIFHVFSVLLTINLVLSVVPSETAYRISILVVNGLTLILNILILPVAYFLIRQNYKPARFFFAAFVVLIFSVFGFVLRNFGIAPSNFLTDYSLQIGSAIEVILLTFAVVDRFKMFKEEAFSRLEEMNELKSRQNEQLEIQVRDRTKEVIDQKELVEHKNREIIDSINYSKRIQNAIIPSSESFKNKFKDAFVVFQPKDIVSGDFYWCGESKMIDKNGEENECTVFSVGDCTGHGVPGAIISVLGLRILMATNNHPEIHNTGDVLNYLNREMSQLFNSEIGEIQIRDGMDIALCAYDKKNQRVFFSGAKNGMFLVRKGEIMEYKGDKRGIGSEDGDYSFSFETIDVEKGDRIILTSDGYADQFGGPLGKKMKPRLFREEIEKTFHLPIVEQGQQLHNFLNEWMGTEYEQTDDVCVVGIEI
ncbi:MAG: 7TM diverse intracellular signaling domain-containing protein [Crocinitomicaceae bacterium]